MCVLMSTLLICLFVESWLKYKGKVNGCPKGIDLGNMFRNFLWEKKKATNLFDSFLYFP